MKYLLLHSPGWSPGPVAAALAADGVELRPLGSLDDPGAEDRPTVLLLDGTARKAVTHEELARLHHAGVALVALGEPEEHDVPAELPAELLSGFVRAPAAPRQLLVALRNGFHLSALHRASARHRAESAARLDEITELTEIAVRLTTEKNYNTLLDLILNQARRISQSDAGSLYVVESDEQGGKRLRFKLSQNDSRPDIPFVEFTMPLDQGSLAGSAALSGEPLVFDDVYTLPADVAYSFDERSGYRTRSMLVIPMQKHHGEVIGVLQLINRKRDYGARLATPDDFARQVIPYSPHTVRLVQALAGQAAVSIENSQLYEAIERLFEGFVKAAVLAIEQRDPTTSGHSERVASRTVLLAKVVDRAEDGPYRQVRFTADQIRELRYAGLLHDFGKVGVREQVLVKAKKLYESDLALIRQRQAFIKRTAHWQFERQRAEFLLRHGREGYAEFLQRLEAEQAQALALADRFLEVVLHANEPTVLAEGEFAQLQEFAALTYLDMEGAPQPFLREPEMRLLSIRKGSLDDAERLEIESHVSHTFDFLRKIPWTKGLSQVADIAYGHHEKLDGSGYPRRVGGEAIPIQTRMMTIADIFDALTAQDRPYKRALPAPRALDILADEVKQGMLDGELFRLFVEGRVWEARDGD